MRFLIICICTIERNNFIKMNIGYLNKYGFFHLLSANFLTQFLGFGSVLIVVKFLSPEEFGEIKMIQTSMGALLLVVGFGFNTGILRFCSAENEEIEKKKILLFSIKNMIYIFFLLFTVILWAYLRGGLISREIFLYSISLPFSGLVQCMSAYLQSQNRIKNMAFIQAIIKIQSVILVVVFTFFWGKIGFVIGTIIGIVLSVIPYLKNIPFKISFLNKEIPNNYVRFSMYAFLGNFTSYIGNYADIFILNQFSINKIEIGYYSFATIFILIGTQINATVQGIITPFFSRNKANGEWVISNLKKNLRRMILLSIAVSVGIYVIVWIFTGNLFFNYKQSLNYLSLLLIKYVIYSFYCIAGVVILSFGYAKYNFLNVLVTTPVSLVLTYWFLKEIGIVGAAYSQIIMSVLNLIISYTLLYWILKREYME